nr:hypothetical protein [Tanacetum cinerariifolium]
WYEIWYEIRDGENLDKMKEKGDECIFVGYSNQSSVYRVFNKRTRVIMESIHVNFDELPLMATDHLSSNPAPECQTMALNHDNLSPANQRQQYTTPLTDHTTPAPTCQVPTLAPTVISSENINQAETYAENVIAEKIARVTNPLALVAQQQPVYHPQNHPTHYTQNSSTRSQQAATRNRGKAIVNSPQPIYDQEPSMVAEDDKMSKDKEIDKLMALISLSSAGYENQRISNVAGARETVGSTVVQKSGIQCYNCKEFRHVARECQKPKGAKDAAYHKEKMLL